MGRGETLVEARAAAGTLPGRRTTIGLTWPLTLPVGDWADVAHHMGRARLPRTARRGAFPVASPSDTLANGGAYAAKRPKMFAKGRAVSQGNGQVVRVLYSREDVVRLGPKRPPVAAGVGHDGEGMSGCSGRRGHRRRPCFGGAHFTSKNRCCRTANVDSSARAAGWAGAAVLVAGASVQWSRRMAPRPRGRDVSGMRVRVRCGDAIDRVVLHSYCIGAAPMALGWVRNGGIAVDEAGEPCDLTIRSFGILRAVDMPHVEVEIDDASGDTVNGPDAVFAAVAAAAWRRPRLNAGLARRPALTSRRIEVLVVDRRIENGHPTANRSRRTPW